MSETLGEKSEIDPSKRTWLIATGCAGTVGGVVAAIPFVSNFQPSEKAKAAGAAVEVDIAGLDECQNTTISEIKAVITRMGTDSKLILTGDVGEKHQGTDRAGSAGGVLAEASSDAAPRCSCQH